ncbi:hydroxymethylglutaryl-CoA reductase, degradative [Cryobacterium sp. TmT2-59]|uniref:hydroxymethylglutaryl-CoA reductase, degradative n=1 Tax=unclassified Cryobacterium TaxID=2649013 RepID=UPI0010695EF9|nr:MULTISPECIES: hydroxymethylglutaryl-CoA reductase, degradative [unclassified Cryobacterium]TFC82947.1 hydroxymethylglutaryl-CoA reductase, degradative [Cryobacterium sp. TmT2-59]TFD17233.1 hydroxymethylglutaryl-CoA reductase, degradative [Cryobacterium sp. TMT4-10]
MSDSRIPKFYRLSVPERLQVLHDRGVLSDADHAALRDGDSSLDVETADRLIENVIGVFSLPMGLGLNFRVNERDYLVPMVVEEPSIVAAVSSTALLVRQAGGFTSVADESLLIGQIQVVDVDDPEGARLAVLARSREIIALADSGHPNMAARGGGARGVEVFLRGETAQNGELLVVHLSVDTRDAMGANLVNSMCEALAPLIEEITGGRVFLRILSNLTDRALVRARAVIPHALLATGEFIGEQVRDGIVLANEFAAMDPYRATTHNKGIMNGVDAVALATGNDWRAIEAAAHAYAARGMRYAPLTDWSVNEHGELVGELTMPLKVGTVGGQVESNPAVRLARTILGVSSARELAEVMAAVGLAQNLAALKALSTRGIQHGHMRLHARAVAAAAGAQGARFDEVVEKLIADGEIKVWKARQIMQALDGAAASAVAENAAATEGTSEAETPAAVTAPRPAASVLVAAQPPVAPGAPGPDAHVGYGKIILLGEHSVVYGHHAIAAPIGLSVRAEATRTTSSAEPVIADWSVDGSLREPIREDISHRVAALITGRLGVPAAGLRVEVFSDLPRASGLGASAAFAVAVIRAVASRFDLRLSDAEVSNLAFECERIVHGTPSGIDNTVATFGRPVLFRKTDAAGGHEIHDIVTPYPIPVVIGLSGVHALTSQTVSLVRTAWQKNPARYDSIFAQIDALVLAGVDALRHGDIAELGELMNINQGLLNALQVSSPEIEQLVAIARRAGALGAKLTGGGGGGAMIAIAEPGGTEPIIAAMRRAGFATYLTELR